MLVSVRILARGRFVRRLQVPVAGCSPLTNADDTRTVLPGDIGCQQFRQIHRTPGLQLLHPRRGDKPKGADRARALLEKSEKKKKAKDAKIYEVWDGITLLRLSKILNVDSVQDVRDLFSMSEVEVPRSDRAPIDARVFSKIGRKAGCKFVIVANPLTEALAKPKEEKSLDAVSEPWPDISEMVPKPPVVTLVGHVDHGKTTLLDRLRKSSIVECESGGITQHIGVFSVKLSGNQKVTFMDTPGHAAFKTMRRRGTRITDIVVLLVDAVEGPLEQTLESLKAIRDHRTPFVVAISKIDKAGADVERVKQTLYQDLKVPLEDFGGDIPCVPISAAQNINIDELIETILAQAEVMQLLCDKKGSVEATVVESSIVPGLGKCTTALVRRGRLRKGDFLVSGLSYAKVRLLLNTTPALSNEPPDKRSIESVGPAEGCKIFGWKGDIVPESGSDILQVPSEKRAKEVIAWRKKEAEGLKNEIEQSVIDQRRAADRDVYEQMRAAKLSAGYKYRFAPRELKYVTRESAYGPIETDIPRVSILVKTDFDGTRDAVLNCLDTYDKNEDVWMDVLGVSVGDVTESDIQMASEFDGLVYTFNAKVSDDVRKKATLSGVLVKEFNVIYKLIDDLREELSQKQHPVQVEHMVGRGTVIEQFLINIKKKKVAVAGCKINQGVFDREKLFRLERGDTVVYSGKISSLKHFKDELPTIGVGKECGLKFGDDTDVTFQSGDVLVCYELKPEIPTLEWDTGF